MPDNTPVSHLFDAGLRRGGIAAFILRFTVLNMKTMMAFVCGLALVVSTGCIVVRHRHHDVVAPVVPVPVPAPVPMPGPP